MDSEFVSDVCAEIDLIDDGMTADEKAERAFRVAVLLVTMRPGLARDLCLARLADRLGVTVEKLLLAFRKTLADE